MSPHRLREKGLASGPTGVSPRVLALLPMRGEHSGRAEVGAPVVPRTGNLAPGLSASRWWDLASRRPVGHDHDRPNRPADREVGRF
jgi:hypothetical protein